MECVGDGRSFLKTFPKIEAGETEPKFRFLIPESMYRAFFSVG
jgi:hypothetical protein